MAFPQIQIYAAVDRVFFYTDATATTTVGPTTKYVLGTNIGQKQTPSRAKGELIGTTTGKREVSSKGQYMLEVDWVNRYWLEGSLLKKGYNVYEQKTSWVKEAEVTFSLPAPDLEAGPIPVPATTGNTDPGTITTGGLNNFTPDLGSGGASSKDNTTIYIIVGAVLVVVAALVYFLRPQKSKR